ncbi:MAG: phosphate/phosphite/phosphonate ABC transporter substrate-binding protein, partial [Gemmatimonadaceae bacterium]|nr:phosphate/phosphite/phosphonate ABC transporter substrate-binding protein [Acetobacteraceae bacterium]
MITRRLTFAGAAAALLAGRASAQTAMPAAGKRDWAAQVPTLRIGLLGGENETDRLRRNDSYRKLLEDTFGIPVRLFPAADYAGVIQAFGAKQIDMASMGSSGYAGAWIETNGNVEPLVVAVESDGSVSYRSVLVVRADSGINSIEDMKGRSLAWADPNSTSGYLIPSNEFRQAGIDTNPGKYFSRTGFGGGHEQAVVAMIQKQYDGSVTWASGLGDVKEGYSRGNLREMISKKLLNPADFKIIWMSRPILNGPLVVRKDTPQS